MTGEQKPGGLEVVAWLYNTVSGEGKALVKPLQYLDGEQVLGVALTPAEPAEARVRELETERDTWKALAENGARQLPVYVTQLAKAKEALRFYADPHERPNEGPWGALSDDWGKRAAETLAALQQEGE